MVTFMNGVCCFRDNNGGDLFVHSSEIECGYLDSEQEVHFDLGIGKRRPTSCLQFN